MTSLVSLQPLVITKCLDCGAVDHKVIHEDEIIRCYKCGSEVVTWPHNPTVEAQV